MRFTKNTQQDTSKVLRLPRKMTMDTSKVLRLPRKLQHIFWKRHKSIAPATQNDFSTRCKTRLNVTKCHACHAKRSNDTSETSKNDHLCRTSHRHGHTVLTRTVANGCGRGRNVERTHPQPPDPQSETGTLATHSGKITPAKTPDRKGWNWWFPTWEPKVTMARNCRFPDLETYGSQPGNQRVPLQGIAGSQKLEFMFSKLSNYHCKELRIPKVWNSWFQTWKSIRYQWKDLLIPKS